jgi:hypothetical protein
MAELMVTQERVFEAAQTLLDKGADPTIMAVQVELGGGSPSTVKEYLDLWKEATPKQRRKQVKLSKVDQLMRLGRKVWGLALVKLH